MVSRVIPNPLAAFFHAVEGVSIKRVLKRTWDAVVNFFTWIAAKIKSGAEWTWTSVKQLFHWEDKIVIVIRPGRQEVVQEDVQQFDLPVGPFPDSLRMKLAAYEHMPEGDEPFLRRSIEILRTVLQRKDEKLTRELANKLAMGPEQLAEFMQIGQVDFTRQMEQRIPPIRPAELPYQLATFNAQVEAMEGECFPKILMAAVRAFVFTNRNQIAHYTLHYFSHTERVYDDVLEAIPGVHIGGRQGRNKYVDYRNQMRELRNLFNQLPNDKKEIILDEFDGDIDTLDLPPNGKKILRDIGAFTNALLVDNQPFQNAAQTILMEVN